MKPFKILSIVVTFNGSNWIDNCLGSLQNSELMTSIVVVDNDSKDDTVKKVKNDYPDVKLIETKQNMGFGKANNIGLKMALREGFDYVFLLNQDAWIKPETIKKLVSIQLSYPSYGIISPIHLNKDETLDRNFSSFLVENEKSEFLLDSFSNNPLKPIYSCSYVNAAAWLISAECLKSNGGFMPVFTHYGEDNNYCQRVLNSDFKIGFTPGITIIHDRGKRKRNYSVKNAFKRLYIEFLVIFSDPKFNIKSFRIEGFKFFLKNLQRPHKFLLLPLVLMKIFFNYSEIKKQRALSRKLTHNFIGI